MKNILNPVTTNILNSSLMSHRACCHTCYTIQLMHYSHFKTQSFVELNECKSAGGIVTAQSTAEDPLKMVVKKDRNMQGFYTYKHVFNILCFFSILTHFYFSLYIYNFLQFFSTCFGPVGPSSGESNYTCSIWHLSLIRCYLVRGRWC